MYILLILGFIIWLAVWSMEIEEKKISKMTEKEYEEHLDKKLKWHENQNDLKILLFVIALIVLMIMYMSIL